MHIDYTQIQTATVSAQGTDGSTFTAENATILPLVIEDAATLVAGYTPGATIDSTTAETIARAVLDALAAYTS